MMKNSSEIGTGDITVKNDPRILPLGKILRDTKIKATTIIKYFNWGH